MSHHEGTCGCDGILTPPDQVCLNRRSSGILMHVSSLPGLHGIGDLGHGARAFVDFLAAIGQRYWQILPLNPVDDFCGNSPYSSHSAFAGNPLLISMELLVKDGLLHASDLEGAPAFDETRADYRAAGEYKAGLLEVAHERFRRRKDHAVELRRFCEENAHWLEDYALFVALKGRFENKPWVDWPEELKNRVPEALDALRAELELPMEREKLAQYLFFRQWHWLKTYCGDRSIRIIGDAPIYTSHDSSDVWAHRDIFSLEEEGLPLSVAGVPPDYFSATGQLWGNPVYRWDVLRETGFEWWIRRMEHNFKLFDVVRLDHFRGFMAYWEIPAGEETAVNGRWVKAPGKSFFDALVRYFGPLPIIAEDLGIITPDVREAMACYGFPGMKILQFAFGPDVHANPYAPHNHTRNNVIYSGTHDNNTSLGWFRKELTDIDRERISRYVGHAISDRTVHWEMVRLALMSVCNTAVLPLQDLLGADETCRMNTPSVAYGNWEWRVREEELQLLDRKRLVSFCEMYGRL